MFGLGTRDGRGELRRHRWFETSFSPPLTRPCAHRRRSVGVYGHAGGRSSRELAQQFVTAEWREAMGIDWMTGEELAQAIPPAFSEFLALAAIVAMEHVPIAAQGGES
jgi:DNA (cytosine-5)-methyltransferase 1